MSERNSPEITFLMALNLFSDFLPRVMDFIPALGYNKATDKWIAEFANRCNDPKLQKNINACLSLLFFLHRSGIDTTKFKENTIEEIYNLYLRGNITTDEINALASRFPRKVSYALVETILTSKRSPMDTNRFKEYPIPPELKAKILLTPLLPAIIWLISHIASQNFFPDAPSEDETIHLSNPSNYRDDLMGAVAVGLTAGALTYRKSRNIPLTATAATASAAGGGLLTSAVLPEENDIEVTQTTDPDFWLQFGLRSSEIVIALGILWHQIYSLMHHERRAREIVETGFPTHEDAIFKLNLIKRYMNFFSIINKRNTNQNETMNDQSYLVQGISQALANERKMREKVYPIHIDPMPFDLLHEAKNKDFWDIFIRELKSRAEGNDEGKITFLTTFFPSFSAALNVCDLTQHSNDIQKVTNDAKNRNHLGTSGPFLRHTFNWLQSKRGKGGVYNKNFHEDQSTIINDLSDTLIKYKKQRNPIRTNAISDPPPDLMFEFLARFISSDLDNSLILNAIPNPDLGFFVLADLKYLKKFIKYREEKKKKDISDFLKNYDNDYKDKFFSNIDDLIKKVLSKILENFHKIDSFEILTTPQHLQRLIGILSLIEEVIPDEPVFNEQLEAFKNKLIPGVNNPEILIPYKTQFGLSFISLDPEKHKKTRAFTKEAYCNQLQVVFENLKLSKSKVSIDDRHIAYADLAQIFLKDDVIPDLSYEELEPLILSLMLTLSQWVPFNNETRKIYLIPNPNETEKKHIRNVAKITQRFAMMLLSWYRKRNGENTEQYPNTPQITSGENMQINNENNQYEIYSFAQKISEISKYLLDKFRL
jgi:hypothetical protein